MLLIIGDHLTGQGGIADYSTLPSSLRVLPHRLRLPHCLHRVCAGGQLVYVRTAVQNPPPVVAVAVAVAVTPCQSRCCAGWPGWMSPSAHCAGRRFPPVRASCGSSRTIWCCCSACRCSTGCCTGCPPRPQRRAAGAGCAAGRLPHGVWPGRNFGRYGVDVPLRLPAGCLPAPLADNRLSRLLNRPAAALVLAWALPLANTAIRAVLEYRGATDSKAFQYIAYYRTALGALPGLLAALALFHFFKNLDLGSNRFINGLADDAGRLSAPGPRAAGLFVERHLPRPGAPRLGGVHAAGHRADFRGLRGHRHAAYQVYHAAPCSAAVRLRLFASKATRWPQKSKNRVIKNLLSLIL